MNGEIHCDVEKEERIKDEGIEERGEMYEVRSIGRRKVERRGAEKTLGEKKEE